MENLKLVIAGLHDKATIKQIKEETKRDLTEKYGREFAKWLYENATWVFWRAFMKESRKLKRS